MRAKRLLVCAVVLFCAGGAASATAAAVQSSWGLRQLMAEFARVRSASAQFTERKTMHMLTQPLVLSGRLIYIAPDHLEKITLSPTRERMIVDGDEVTLAGPNNDIHTFSLSDDPRIGGLIAGIRATLSGDLRTLDRFYIVRFSGTPAAWNLKLFPRDSALTRFVKWIDFRGKGERIETLDTEDSDGDHSEMSIVEDVRDAP